MASCKWTLTYWILDKFLAQLSDTNVSKHEKNECFIRIAAVNTHLHVRSHNTVDACDFQKTDRSRILHLVCIDFSNMKRFCFFFLFVSRYITFRKFLSSKNNIKRPCNEKGKGRYVTISVRSWAFGHYIGISGNTIEVAREYGFWWSSLNELGVNHQTFLLYYLYLILNRFRSWSSTP